MPDTQKDFYKKLLGNKGERLVERELKKRGYEILKRNYKTPVGEADLIAFKNGEVIFVEVKTRSSNVFGKPCEAVGYKKQEKYRKIAECYFVDKGGVDNNFFSFVVAEVTKQDINIIFNAF